MKDGLNDLGAFVFCSSLCIAGTWIFIASQSPITLLGFCMIAMSVAMATVVQKK